MRKKCLLSLVLLALICPMFALSGCGTKGTPISAEERTQMSERAEQAQYLPEIEEVFGMEPPRTTLRAMAAFEECAETEPELYATDFDVFRMEKLLQSLATVEGTGAGKYLGYDVREVKTELYHMVSRAPYLNAWFRVPRESGSVDYYSNWAYLIENNLEYNFLSMTRISYRTRASYIDPDTGAEIEYYDGGSAIQYNVMRTEFYFEEETEIVEVSMLDVMLEHGNPHFCGYQHFKNARNRYFVKYDIKAKPRTDRGYALDTNTPYGADRSFVYMTYDREANYELLQLNQQYPHKYRISYPSDLVRPDTLLTYIRRENGHRSVASLSYSYGEEGLLSETVLREGDTDGVAGAVAEMSARLKYPSEERERYIAAASTDLAGETERFAGDLARFLVDGHALAEDWDRIIGDSDRAAEEKLGAEVDLPLQLKYHYFDAWIEGKELDLSADAYLVPNPSFRGMTRCDYYLAPALMDLQGDLHFLYSGRQGTSDSFEPDTDIMWYGTWLELNLIVPFEAFVSFREPGTYALAVALRKDGSEGHFENRSLSVRCGGEDAEITADGMRYRFMTRDGLLLVEISEE